MKKALCLLLAIALSSALLASCTPTADENSFTAQNEIFTYERIDAGKTQIVVSKTGNISLEPFCDAFEQKNPDIQVIILDITGGNSSVSPIADWIEKGYAADVTISEGRFISDEKTPECFENLSGNPVVDSYEADALKRTSIDGNIYMLPGPSNINAMVYNKTLFEKYGWELPDTFDEFMELCLRIRKDTNGEIEPWNPNAKYSDELLTAMEAITYEELFGGLDNRTWYNDFIQGNASFKGHMEPYYEALQKLSDNGILREEHFTYSATARGKEFKAGKIAMINAVISDFSNGEYEFGYMPFPHTTGNLGYICDNYSCLVGVMKKEHTDKELDAIDRFLHFFSTPEGQQIFIGDSIKVSNVKDALPNQASGLDALQPAIDGGHMFERIGFGGELGRPLFDLHKDALDIATGAKTADDCIEAVDAEPYAVNGDGEAPAPEIIAVAEKDMTILETSFYIADAYREAAGADIGLIANNTAYRGNLMRIFAGELAPQFVNALKPRSFANDAKLEMLSMTGRQLLDAMNEPPDYNDGTANCIYAYSGLKCKIAPWAPLGEKYLAVKTLDGKDIDEAKLYTVAAWEGTIPEAYITEHIQAYKGSWEDILTSKMKAGGTVSPANDERIKLVWD